MSDWRSYDWIADRYDRSAGGRFAAAAAFLASALAPERGARALDLGTGTGLVARAVSDAADLGLAVGCDRSAGMLAEARRALPRLRAVVGDVRALPFSDAAFDVVTAGFVLSHVAEVEVAVREAHRVLRGGGRFAVSAWEAADDEHTAFWSERLAEAITPGEAGHARAALVPSEDAMADAEGFAAALRRAGFEVAALQRPEITAELTLDEYLDDRDISAGARRGRHLLGPEGWAAFRVSVRDGMAQRFGRSLRFSRRILVTVARK